MIAPEYSIAGVFAIRMKRTFDSSATPDVGAVILDAPRGRASIDLTALEAKMDWERKVEPLLQTVDRLGEAYDAYLESFSSGDEPSPDSTAQPAANRAPISQRVVDAPMADATPSRQEREDSPGPAAQPDGGEPTLKAGALRMLDVLARYGPLPRRDLAVLSRVSPVSGTVSDYLSVLRRRALVTEANGQVEATPAGVALVHPDGKIPARLTPDQVYGLWSGDLKAGARRMVEHLMRVHPDGFTRRELAGLAGISPQSGTVSDYMSTLRRRGLVVERARRVYAGEVLYLGAKR